ncbi:MAG TPA: hypothetical protein VMQ40_01035 [Acidimicrobiales bacterium]|jgi:hypothetical protein|nr:hypothetical protein [Acidimicrobiales bacterium]
MDTFLAVLAAIVVVLAGARLLQRRRRDEIRSIHHYHDRLDTLHVEPHDRGGSVRVVRGPQVPGEPAAPGRPRLDPSSAHLDTSPGALPAEPRTRHDRDWALERMQPRAHVDMATILIVATVIVVLVAIALVGYAIQHGRATTSTTSTSTTRPVTTNTQPTAYVGRVSSGGTAMYLAPSGRYSLTVTGTGGRVWVSAATPLSSTHTLSRLVAAGGSTTFHFDASVILVLGAPGSATVTLDGVGVTLPARYRAPLSLEFRPRA